MSTIVTDSKNYTVIANKIRKRLGSDGKFLPSEMSDGIRAVYENGRKSFGLLETVIGAGAVRADFVNKNEHHVDVAVSSKNKLKFDDLTSSKTNGLIANISEGVATITGEFTGADSKVYDRNFVHCTNYGDFATIKEERSFILPKGTYTLSLTGTDNSIDHIVEICLAYGEIGHYMQDKSGLAFYVAASIDSPTTFIVKEDCYCQFMFHVRHLTTEPTAFTIDAVVKPQLEPGTSVTPFTPFVEDVSTLKLNRFGENLFDKNNPNIISNWIANSSTILNGGILNTAATTKSVYIPCAPNATYTVSKIVSARFSIAFANDVPTTGMHLSGYVSNFTSTELTSTAPADAKYLVVWCYHQNYDTDITFEEIIDSLQIEVSETATPYKPYIAPIEYSVNPDGTVDGVTSLSPCMTLVASDSAVAVEATYYADIAGKVQVLSDTILELGGEL